MTKNATQRKEIIMALTKTQDREILSAAGVKTEHTDEYKRIMENSMKNA